MTNAPSAVILRAFYARMTTLAIVYGLIVLTIFVVRRYRLRQSALRAAADGRDDSAIDRGDGPPGGLFAGRATRYDVVRIGVGLLWIFDGLLQAQPDMSTELLSNIVVPLFSTLPTVVVRELEPLVVVLSEHPLTFDLFVMWTQVTLGLLLLFARPGRLRRLALFATLFWGFGVWVVGEGMGGVYGTGATWLVGSPGAVLFYMAAAVLLLQGRERWRDGRVASELRWLFFCLWLWGALIQAWPPNGFWTAGGLQGPLISMAQMPQPHFLSALLYGCAHLLAAHPVWWNGLLVGAMLSLAVGYAWFSHHRFVLYATCAWLALTWVFGQDFGVMGGLGTDPNSSPVAALLLVGLRPDAAVRSESQSGVRATGRA